MARPTRVHKRTARSGEHRRIRSAFALFMILSVAILAVFSAFAVSTAFSNLGPWRASVFFGFALVFAILSYKGADTAMFGAYVTAYFVSVRARRASSEEGEARKKVWGLGPYLAQHRQKALASSAAALVYGVMSLLAYAAFLLLGLVELIRAFDWPLVPSIVGLALAVLTLAAAVPVAIGSVSAMRAYFVSGPIPDPKIESDDESASD